MPSYKDKNGTWYVSYFVTDYTGKKKRKLKRGFKTKKEAERFLAEELLADNRDLSMSFDTFTELYLKDVTNRNRLSTNETKMNNINTHILPYFKHLKMNQIKSIDVIQWQNEILSKKKDNGEPYAPSTLKTIHNQLSAIFNHACKYYGLRNNPAREAGNMGKEQVKEKVIWSEEQYHQFLEAISDRPESYYAFEVLFYTGIRTGELTALTIKDIDFENRIIKINKSCQRIRKVDYITEPKTKKSTRVIPIPDFLCEELKEYISQLYEPKPTDRLFPFKKGFLRYEIQRGCKKCGIKDIITPHGFRHSHISLCVDSGFSPVEVGDRAGQKSVQITLHYAHLYQSKARAIANELDERRKEKE